MVNNHVVAMLEREREREEGLNVSLGTNYPSNHPHLCAGLCVPVHC